MMPNRALRVVLAALVLVPAAVTAQTAPSLFELRPGSLPDRPGVEVAWRVAIDPQLVMAAPRLRLDMPDGLELEAARSDFVRRGRLSGTWIGRVAGDRQSQVILSMTDGVLAGFIQSRYGEYDVRPLPSERSAGGQPAEIEYSVARMDPNRPQGCEPRTADVGGDEAAPPATSPPIARDGAGQIDIMVLFTPEARDEAGSAAAVRATIGLMVDTANQAFANSRMDARLNVVYTGPSPFPDAGVGEDDLDLLTGSTQVANLRNAHQADLVALIGSNDLLTGPDAVCGIAWVMRDPQGFEPFAMSVTALACTLTFAHEVGHNMGFEHDPANSSATPETALYPWAFGHFVANDFRTVMAYPDPCGNCQRVLHFSSPRVRYEGKWTGIVNARDNARAGNGSGPIVANFRLSGVVFQDDFEGDDLGSWSTVRSGLNLVEPGLGGSSQALEVTLTGNTARRYLAHKVPAPGTGVDLEFLLNADRADLGGTELVILEFFSQGQPHVSLTLQPNGATYLLTLYAKGAGDDLREIASTPVRAAIDEKIGIRWRAATSPEEADGYVRLLKNDGPRGTVTDLDNGLRTVREIRIGVPQGTVGTGTATRFLIDDYRAGQPAE
jgi:hypothetical protein